MPHPSRRVLSVLIVVVLAAAVLPAIAGACPLCKDAKSDSDYAGGTASLPNGFYYSILFMVCVPFTVVGTFVAQIILARRRLRLAEGLEAKEPRRPVSASSALAGDPAGSRS